MGTSLTPDGRSRRRTTDDAGPRGRDALSRSIISVLLTVLLVAGGCAGDDDKAVQESPLTALSCENWHDQRDVCSDATARLRCSRCAQSDDVTVSLGFDRDGYLNRFRVDTPNVRPEVLRSISEDMNNPSVVVKTDNLPDDVLKQLDLSRAAPPGRVRIEVPNKICFPTGRAFWFIPTFKCT